MNDNKKWFRFLAIVPLIVLFVFTNVYEDPANIFHDDSAEIVEALLDGNEAYFGSGNGNARNVKLKLIEEMPKHIECLTLGPSLTLGIRKENVGTDSYYNLSVTGMLFQEYLIYFGLLQINDVKVDRVILCVDSYFFDESKYSGGISYPEMMPYATYMLELLQGENPNEPEKDIKNGWLQIQQAFSVTYFQSSVAYVQNNNSYKIQNKRWGIIDEATEDLAHYLSDGSWVYAFDYRNRTEEDVLTDATSYPIEKRFAKGSHISEYSKDIFWKLINYLTEQGTTVEFFLCPLAPALWDRIENDSDAGEYYILDELETFALEVADEFGIKVIGSYNPYNINVKNADFWDARHMRHEVLETYFDFSE